MRNMILFVLASMFLLMGVSALATSKGDTLSEVAAADSMRTGFYILRPDFRRCVSPLCGGSFARALNLSKTLGGDQVFADDFYVAEVDMSALNLDSDSEIILQQEADVGLVILKGTLTTGKFAGFGQLGVLVVNQAWRAATENQPSDAFYKLKENGIVCITSPCFSLAEKQLNTGFKTDISGLDLSTVGASAKKIQQAADDLDGPGIIASGDHSRPMGQAGVGAQLDATQFYIKVRRRQRLE